MILFLFWLLASFICKEQFTGKQDREKQVEQKATLVKAHCKTKAVINCKGTSMLNADNQVANAFPAGRGVGGDSDPNMARGGANANMANTGPHWLGSWTLLLALEHTEFWERGLLNRSGEKLALLAVGSWLWLGTPGLLCTWTLWISGPCCLHGQQCSWDLQMPGPPRAWAHMVGNLLLEAGPTLGCMPCQAPASETL